MSKTGKVLAGPDLVSRGFVYVRENESLMDGAQSIVENALLGNIQRSFVNTSDTE